MGLDQYLHASRFSFPSPRLEEYDAEFDAIKKVLGDDAKFLDKSAPAASIEITVGYWRKANAIHKWFVENCQQGIDDCRTAGVDREQLKELKSLCSQVIKTPDKASELLPTQSGFFFGSEDYDEWYTRELRSTINIINKCLRMGERWNFTYSSSW